jgi:mRNA-degrading endonuclease RelE of RelBE toxin-antitoxin system
MAAKHFSIEYDQEAEDDLKAVRSFDQKRIVDAIAAHLRHTPTNTSGSRIKFLEEPFWCQYRLRVGEFRVYYDVDEPERRVNILRVLRKGRKTTPKRPKDDKD